MCLSLVRQTYDPPLQGVKTAYKIVVKKANLPPGSYELPVINEVLEVGVWNTARVVEGKDSCMAVGVVMDNRYITHENIQYPYGFHLYTTLEDAKRFLSYSRPSQYRIMEVEYDDVVAQGIEEHADNFHDIILQVIVVKRLKLIKELV